MIFTFLSETTVTGCRLSDVYLSVYLYMSLWNYKASQISRVESYSLVLQTCVSTGLPWCGVVCASQTVITPAS